MTTKKEILYLTTIIGLSVLLIALKLQFNTPSKSNEPIVTSLKNNYTLIDKNYEVVRFVQDFPGEYILLIVFSLSDCPACLEEYKVWNSLTEFYPKDRFQIVGVMDQTEMEYSDEFGLIDSLLFPVYFDQGDLLDILPIHVTPTKFLLNPDRELIFIDGNNAEAYKQLMFGKIIRSIVGYPLDNVSG